MFKALVDMLANETAYKPYKEIAKLWLNIIAKRPKHVGKNIRITLELVLFPIKMYENKSRMIGSESYLVRNEFLFLKNNNKI